MHNDALHRTVFFWPLTGPHHTPTSQSHTSRSRDSITDFLSQTLLRENKALQQLQQPPSSTTGAGAGAPSPTNSNSSSSSKRPPSGPAAALPRVPSPPHPGINAHL